MKTRNLIGKIFFFGMGILLIVTVFYHDIIHGFLLTEKEPEPISYFGNDGITLALAFFFIWGGAKFGKLSDWILNKITKTP